MSTGEQFRQRGKAVSMPLSCCNKACLFGRLFLTVCARPLLGFRVGSGSVERVVSFIQFVHSFRIPIVRVLFIKRDAGWRTSIRAKPLCRTPSAMSSLRCSGSPENPAPPNPQPKAIARSQRVERFKDHAVNLDLRRIAGVGSRRSLAFGKAVYLVVATTTVISQLRRIL